MQGKKWAGPPALILCAIGFVVSYYLFARGVKLTSSGATGTDVCSAVFQASCDATLLSDHSKFLGLSFAGWGAAYFLSLGALIVLSMALRDIMHRQMLTGAAVLNLGGLVISGYLSWLLLSGEVAFCPLCFLTHLINLSLLPTVLLFRGGGLRSVSADVGQGLNYIFGGPSSDSTENSARALAFATALLLGVVAFEWFMLRSRPAGGIQTVAQPSASESQLINNIVQAYLDQPPVDVPVGPNDPREGSPDAPLQLVVFSDFECPSCKSNSTLLERLVAAFGDKLSIVYKNYPLSSECNANIGVNVHPFACGAAYAGLAAHRQGKFVPFHHLLYRVRGVPSPEAIEQVARQVGIDFERLKQDMESEAVREQVKQDIELAKQLKVIQTPTMFLNGRLLTSSTAPHVGVIGYQLLDPADRPATND